TADPASREAALGLLVVAPSRFGPGGLDTAAAWCALGREVRRTSRRLAAAYFERTAPGLAGADRRDRLRASGPAGLRLDESRGWRRALLAQAYFDAAPAALEQLAPSDYEPWAALGATLAGARDTADEREFFAAVPRSLPDWTAGERGHFLRAMSAIAGAVP